MPRQCIFCPNPADSAEHLWSDWILEDLKPVQPIHIRFGKTFAKWVDDPEVRIRCVCHKCNNEWMNDIEGENKPHMLAMMNDKPFVLQPSEQKLLTRWALLKAMVLDAASPKRRPIPFYSESERVEMRPPSRFFPVGTSTWIGRLSVKVFHAGLTESFQEINNIPKAFHACVTTIVVGHLAIQVMTPHILARFAPGRVRPVDNPGPWDANLLEIWPVFGEKSWPPPSSFELGGDTRNIARLVNRWKIGTDITR